MIPIFTTIFFIFGLIIGSFLNVVIARYHTARSFGGRSACMSCQNKLCWYELVPLVSFFALKGRCRTCKTKISITYPLVELVTGLIFAALFFKFQDVFFINTSIFVVTYAYYAIIFSLLVVVVVYDLKHKIIPDSLSFIFGVLGFIGLFFFNSYGFFPHIPTLLEFLSGVFIALPFALLWFMSAGTWIGLGDAKIILGLGWFLGFSRALSAVAVAFWIGAIIGLYLIIFSKNYGMKSEIPFAFYLVFGAFLAFLFDLNLFIVGF